MNFSYSDEAFSFLHKNTNIRNNFFINLTNEINGLCVLRVVCKINYPYINIYIVVKLVRVTSRLVQVESKNTRNEATRYVTRFIT